MNNVVINFSSTKSNLAPVIKVNGKTYKVK